MSGSPPPAGGPLTPEINARAEKLKAEEDLRKALAAHRDWCEQMLADLDEVRASLGDDPTWRNATLVADWGLDYYRGDLAAVEGVGRAVLDD